MNRSGMILILALLMIAIALNVGTSQITASASTPGKCDARCWYIKYKQEQRKSARLGRNYKATKRVTQELRPWINLASCETTLRWQYNGSSGYDGGLQFLPSTWTAYGGRTFSRYAWQATPIQQVAIAQKVLRRQGRSAWPGCSRKGAW